jgi:uncharacterized protein (TIGR03118 family)
MPARLQSNLQFVCFSEPFGISSQICRDRKIRTAMSMFCSDDGVVSGWRLDVVLPKEEDLQFTPEALILVDNSKAGAVYKGCTLSGTSTAPLIFVAKFATGTVDVIDGALNLNPGIYSHSLANPMIPAGFSPFNVRNINGTIFVTYARQDSEKHDDVPGFVAPWKWVSHGAEMELILVNLVDEFDADNYSPGIVELLEPEHRLDS